MLVFFVLLNSIIILIYLSGISIKIDSIEIEKKEKIKLQNLKIDIFLLLFNKIKILKLTINKKQIEKINFNNLLKKFKKRKIKKDSNFIIRNLKEIKIKVQEIKISAKFGFSDAVLLAYLVALLNIILSIFYAKIARGNKENYRYTTEVYQTNNFYLKLSINCIINVKIANIINMIIRNRSEVKNERTSNRIVNGNSYG